MSIHFKQHLHRHYVGKGENVTRGTADPIHLTLYAGRSYADIVRRVPKRDVIGIPSRPTSVHIYGITDDRFVLELRNIPMSVALDQFVLREGDEVDDGQNHQTVRLNLQSSDGPLLRELAQLVRMAPRNGRTDRFSGHAPATHAVCRALVMLAEVLEQFHPVNSETAAVFAP